MASPLRLAKLLNTLGISLNTPLGYWLREATEVVEEAIEDPSRLVAGFLDNSHVLGATGVWGPVSEPTWTIDIANNFTQVSNGVFRFTGHNPQWFKVDGNGSYKKTGGPNFSLSTGSNIAGVEDPFPATVDVENSFDVSVSVCRFALMNPGDLVDYSMRSNSAGGETVLIASMKLVISPM